MDRAEYDELVLRIHQQCNDFDQAQRDRHARVLRLAKWNTYVDVQSSESFTNAILAQSESSRRVSLEALAEEFLNANPEETL